MRESSHATFTIESPKLTAAELEAQLGLKPDVSWVAGTARGVFGARAKNHGFALESALSPNEPYDRHLKELLVRLLPYAQKLGAIPDLDIELVLSLHRKQAPAVDIPRDELRVLGVIGARLRIDTQIVSDQPRGGAAPAAKPETGAKPSGGF